jgi:hypothetical protein
MSLELRDVSGLPPPDINPPVIAQSGDPFSALRVAHLVARLPRGRAVRLRDIVDQLNHEYLDWSFDRKVVVSVLVQLQSNWSADYRSREGIALLDGPAGEEVVIEDSARVEPWIVRQVERLAADCRAQLRRFARDEGVTP